MTRRGESSGPDVSREGVQRDLLPLVEGCTVSTKHGMVKTDHILFIASGSGWVTTYQSLPMMTRSTTFLTRVSRRSLRRCDLLCEKQVPSLLR